MRAIVIGGGIAGATAGAALAADCDVTILEAESAVGYHASGRSAALFEEFYGSEVVRALNRASKDTHAAMGVLSPRGLLMAALADEGEAFEADAANMGLEVIAPDEARAKVPILSDEIALAAYRGGASDIDTDKLLQGFLRVVRDNGGRVVTGARVTAVGRGDGWRVESPGGDFEADIVVNAAGAWADQVAEMAGVRPVGLTPLRRSIARLPAPGGHDVSGWPMLFGAGESWYAKADAGGWIVSPADEELSEPMDAWADDMVIAEGLARYEAHVTEPVTRVETTWAGLRTFAPDRALVIGEDPRVDGFFWMAGQGGYGMQTSPAAGQLLGALVAGRKPDLPAADVAGLSPARFA